MSLTSRERMLAAINCEEADYVPFYPNFIGPWTEKYWKNQIERKIQMLGMGFDQNFRIGIPPSFFPISPEVKVKLWKETPANEKYPILYKVYETPAGDLRQVVVKTEDWPHGDDIPARSGFIIAGGRSREYIIKGPENLEQFQYLMDNYTQERIERFRRDAQRQRELAKKYGALVDADGGHGGSLLAALCGLQRVAVWIFKSPGFVKELLEVVHEWDMKRIRLALSEDPDLVWHSGWYESPEWWTLKGVEKFIVPLLLDEIELVHSAGKKFCYLTEKGIMHTADILKKVGIDILWGIDPIAEGKSPQEMRSRLGSDVCLWGGMSEAVTFQQGTEAEIRKSTKDAIKSFAPGGGLIFSTIGSIFTQEGWERKGPILIKAWRKYGKYPMKGSFPKGLKR